MGKNSHGFFLQGDDMATNVTLNGVVYAIPAEGDSGWGTVLSNFFISIGSNVLQKTGGNFIIPFARLLHRSKKFC